MTLGSHQKIIGETQVHITPKWIIDAVGPFDLDPCAEHPCAWYCAEYIYTEKENGLAQQWSGMVWCNPPFDRRVIGAWLERMTQHNNGIALIHARTETKWFRHAWQAASAILFMDKRLNFCRPNGEPNSKDNGNPGNSGAPPVLVAFGEAARLRLQNCGIGGALVDRWEYRAAKPDLAR